MSSANDFMSGETVAREPPRPLTRDLPPADPFPVDALGNLLGNAALAIHDRVQAPMAIGGQSVLGAAALAAQGHADIALPIGAGSARPLSLYLITVAATGERKSECDRQALWPIEKHEANLRASYEADAPDYLNSKTAWDKAREAAVKAGKGNKSAIKFELEAIGPAPRAPLEPILTCPEPTFEGLCKLFAVGQASLGIFATEGGQFIGGHGMNDDAKLKTACGLSDLWDGKAIRRVRGGDGATVLPGRRLSLHLMAQPGVAAVLFTDHLLEDQGLLSRLLVTAPESAAGTRFWHAEQPGTDTAIKRYGARLLAMIEAPLPLRSGASNELEPRRVPLSPVAQTSWINFANYIEKAIAPDGALETIRGLANKLPEHAARLAGVLRSIEDIDYSEVGVSDLDAGIALAEHYAAEALRLFGTSQVPVDLQLAQRLLNWLIRVWTENAISLPDIYRRGPSAVRESATAQKLVDILSEHGWLERIKQGAVVAGQRRRDAWLIVRG
jgi:hypothetical protein